MANYCHLSYEDRINIENGLNNNKSINKISKEIDRNHSTILREIDRNKKFSEPSQWNNFKKNNPDIDLSCDRLKKSPYVCNGCKSRSGCRKLRYTYYAREAQKMYEELKIDSRTGIDLTQSQIDKINEVIKPLLDKGQTLNHLYINHPETLDLSKTTFYRHVNNGVFNFGPLDFPRIVKYKHRKKKKTRRTRQEREILKNRKYTDFIEYISNNPNTTIVEMDTVEGINTEQFCFLTLLWRNSNFMLIFKLESQTKDEVSKVFKWLQETLDYDTYKKMFEVILTDNGHEFYGVEDIENIQNTGENITKLFYCDPGASYQKGALEKNYEFIRYVLPKKTSFKDVTKEQVILIMNNINNLCRESLNDKTPYEAMQFLVNKEILKKLNNYYIAPDDVILNKSLLK